MKESTAKKISALMTIIPMTGLLIVLGILAKDIYTFYSTKGVDTVTVKSVRQQCEKNSCHTVVQATSGEIYAVKSSGFTGVTATGVQNILADLEVGATAEVSYIGFTGPSLWGTIQSVKEVTKVTIKN